MATPSNLSEQILALPDGAGAAIPAAQTFQVRPYSGTGSYTIPIETQPGHAGLVETIALVYSTHGGNGIAGQGWFLDLASVQRRTDKGIPSFNDDTDLFTLQADELLPTGGGAYRMRIESGFARIRHVIANGSDFWAVTERDGKRVLYGLESDHRLHDDGGRIAAWFVSKVQDANGNTGDFSYTRDRASRDARLTAVEWAGCYRVTFHYESRPDPIVTFRPGFGHTQQHRLSEIEVEVRRSSDGVLATYRRYSFSYRTSPLTGRSVLAAVGVTGINPDGRSRDLPALSFSYTEPDLLKAQWHQLSGSLPGGSLKDRNLTLVRQSGSGLPDLLETTEMGHWLRTNLGDGVFGAPKRVTAPSQVLLDQPGTFISDMSGRGWGDLVVNGGSRVYQAAAGGGWGATYVSSRAPSVDLEAADVRVADLNGDGIPDALRSNSGAWLYFENLGEGEWAPAQRVQNPPPVRLDDARVHLADINGDGIPDIVYMEQSRIRVWPGTGAGRFGQPFEIQHPPDLGSSFDPKAVRWADMTGSGQADLLYVRNGSVTICFNHAGFALSDPVTVARVAQSAQGHVEPVDLLGSGAQGLLFTDEQYQAGTWRYLELFAEGCPDLLVTIDNGFGAVTSIEYATSARDWIADKRSGKPWRTALPSPQVTIASTTTVDTVTNTRIGVQYRYHHGVYDGTEREFRGYARVEQIDREADAGDAQPLPSVLVKRWYFTGADIDLRDEYTPLPEGAVADQIPHLPWALRSLRGQLRREETFAQDGDPRPYLVAQTGYRVFAIQRTPGTARYSFAPLPYFSRKTYVERSDERRTSEVTTIYDCDTGTGYGLPVEVREKGYGRVGEDAEPAQRNDLERYTKTRYLNLDRPEIDYSDNYSAVYIAGKPALTEKYGVTPSGDVLLERTKFFYDGEDYKGLGYPGSGTEAGLTRGRLSSRLALAFTNELVSTTLGSQPNALAHFQDRGHFLEDADGFYIHTARSRYDTRGMTVGTMDPNGNVTTFSYDPAYGLFPVLSTDAAGHPSRIVRGEWPFQAATFLDANGNTTSFMFDPTGFLGTKAVQGKFDGSDWTGDPPTFPTESYAYDLEARPVQLAARKRQIRGGATLDSFRYLDGFGRLVQEVQTAEPDPRSSAARYRVSGWKVFNHKGLAVRIYQPKFSDSEQYVPGATSDASVEIRYDPLGRAVRVNHPDGTYETTTYHPWLKTFADRNDNSAEIPADDPRYGRFLTDLRLFAGTPARTFVDALGRIVALAEDNGGGEIHTSRKAMDLADRVIAFWDARAGADPTWSFTFDLTGRPVYSNHPNAIGERYAVLDAAGNAIWARDARGVEVSSYFDVLNRRLETWSDDGSGRVLRCKSHYLPYDENDPNFAANQALNLFGRTEEERDADGIRVLEYDWRGLNTRTTYRFWPQRWDDAQSPLWTQGSGWDPGIASEARDVLSWLDLPGLDSFEVSTAYDSAARPVETQYPGGMAIRNTYNVGGLLSGISADRGDGAGFQVIVDSLEYNARGQHVSYRHGNGVMTTREYDPDVERLLRITTRSDGASPTYFQDLSYSYDPMSNLLEAMDNLAESNFSHNRIIPNTRKFGYDPRYRLVRAEGKKHRSVRRREDNLVVPSPDPNDYEPYTFRYSYDAAGNFVRNPEYARGDVKYLAGRSDLFNGSGDEIRNFRYDASGNATHTPRHEELAYTFDGKVRYVDLKGGGTVRYLRHGDERVVRMAKKNGASVLSIYAGNFEYQIRKGTRNYAKLVLHVNGHGRHAQLERVVSGADRDSLDLFFHHSDYIKSGHVLTTVDGDLLSQEEYFPYGGSSDRRDRRNRYRFIGVERDEDTHLCMTGPRTYDPATGRFLQPDLIAENRPDVSPYVYSSSSPVVVLDPGGYQPEDGGDGGRVDPDLIDTEQIDLDMSGLNVEEFADSEISPLNEYERMPLQDRRILDFKLTPPGLHTDRAVWETTTPPQSLIDDPVREAQRSGESAARGYAEAQEMMELGIDRQDMELVTAADEVMRDVERSMETRAAVQATNAAAVVGLHSAADAGLELARRHLVAGLPLIGLLVAGQTLADAKDEYSHGEYFTAGLQVGSLVYDPIDIGMAVAGVRIYAQEKYKEYRAEQTSISIDNEIRRLNTQQRGESTQPVYSSPCDICHY